MSAPLSLVSYQGHYAGSVSRFTAYAIDLAATSAVFSLALACVSYGALARQAELAPAGPPRPRPAAPEAPCLRTGTGSPFLVPWARLAVKSSEISGSKATA